jgi:hypothetical protein
MGKKISKGVEKSMEVAKPPQWYNIYNIHIYDNFYFQQFIQYI